MCCGSFNVIDSCVFSPYRLSNRVRHYVLMYHNNEHYVGQCCMAPWNASISSISVYSHSFLSVGVLVDFISSGKIDRVKCSVVPDIFDFF